jgi:hypothetical protein
VLKPGGAMITVTAAPPGVKTVDGWVNSRSKARVRVQQEERVKNFRGNSSGCRTALRVVSEWNTGGSERWQVITDTYCITKRGIYDIELINWRSDPHQRDFQAVALTIAESFRIY